MVVVFVCYLFDDVASGFAVVAMVWVGDYLFYLFGLGLLL